MSYLSIAAAVVIAMLAASCFFLFKHGESLAQDLATERANVVTLQDKMKVQQAAITKLEVQRAKDQAQINRLGEKNNVLQTAKEEAVAELNGFRTRLDRVAIKKPGLVGRLATRATCRVMYNFQSASGGDTSERNPCLPPASPLPNHSTASGD